MKFGVWNKKKSFINFNYINSKNFNNKSDSKIKNKLLIKNLR